ncbi:MAG: VCBS repeat-containing protein [Lentisphaeria bacterium]|nr:VCBS repeat-containing protein [Lentisphaeria bacterium]
MVNSAGTFNYDDILDAQAAAKAYVAQGIATELHINTVLSAAMELDAATSDFSGITLIFDKDSGSTARFDATRIANNATLGDVNIIVNGGNFSDRISGGIGNNRNQPGPDGTTSQIGNISMTLTDTTVAGMLVANAEAYVTGNVTMKATGSNFTGSSIYGANFGSTVCGNISISLEKCTLSETLTMVYGTNRSKIGGTVEINAVEITGGSICGNFSGSGFADHTTSAGATITVKDSTLDWICGAYSQHTVNGDIVINVTGSTITGVGQEGVAALGSVAGFAFSVTSNKVDITVDDCVLGRSVVGGHRYGTSSVVETGDVYVKVTNSVGTSVYGVRDHVLADTVSVYLANVELSGEVVVLDGGTASYAELVIGAGTTTIADYLDDQLTNLVFDITEGAAYLVNEYIVSSGVSIKADTTKSGSYKLATGFEAQDTVFTVQGLEGSVQLSSSNTSGTIRGENGSVFTLTMEDGELLLEVVGGTAAPEPPPVVEAKFTTDVVLTITDTNHAYFGATGAWKVMDDQKVVWQDLSTLSGDYQILGLGKTAAGKAMSDVYIYSASNKYIGAYVTDENGAIANFATIFAGESALMQVGLGDFNADGVSDLMLRTADGYLANGAFQEVKGVGSEWQVKALGDFNGDGTTDIAIAHTDGGYVGAYLIGKDGSITWGDLGSTEGGIEIVGAGDFNADGTDDVLVKVGNYYGAWLCGNGAVTGFFGIGTFDAEVQDIADYNADGTDDVLFRTTGGIIGAALITGSDASTWAEYGALGAEWSTKGCGVL